MAWNDEEWNVRAPEGECHACARAFEDGEEFTSQLVFVAGEGYARRDFCANCSPAADAPLVSMWRTRYHAPAPAAEPALKQETAESLLRQLVSHPGAEDAHLIYVLAIMLERQRLIVERDLQVMESGERRRVYEHRKTGEIWIIQDPGLKLSDLEKVQAEVVARLSPGGSPSGGEGACST
ncbi:MAG: hypothetical protein KBA51_02155 [Kiritimatiellae bacterium]|nr:hypothetical protein [Kiritimatiellia bacterium]